MPLLFSFCSKIRPSYIPPPPRWLWRNLFVSLDRISMNKVPSPSSSQRICSIGSPPRWVVGWLVGLSLVVEFPLWLRLICVGVGVSWVGSFKRCWRLTDGDFHRLFFLYKSFVQPLECATKVILNLCLFLIVRSVHFVNMCKVYVLIFRKEKKFTVIILCYINVLA